MLSRAPAAPGDRLDGLDRNVKEMRGDGRVASTENGSGLVDALFDQVGVTDGVLTDGPVDDISLGGVNERGQVPGPTSSLRVGVHPPTATTRPSTMAAKARSGQRPGVGLPQPAVTSWFGRRWSEWRSGRGARRTPGAPSRPAVAVLRHHDPERFPIVRTGQCTSRPVDGAHPVTVLLAKLPCPVRGTAVAREKRNVRG